MAFAQNAASTGKSTCTPPACQLNPDLLTASPGLPLHLISQCSFLNYCPKGLEMYPTQLTLFLFWTFFFGELLRKFLGNNLCEDPFVIMTYRGDCFSFLIHSLSRLKTVFLLYPQQHHAFQVHPCGGSLAGRTCFTKSSLAPLK